MRKHLMENSPKTLVQLLSRATLTWAGLPALYMHGVDGWAWSYRELWDASRSVAGHLQACGVMKGDRVILWGPNRPEWVAAFFGILLIGAVAVPLDVHSREDLLTEIELQTQPRYALIGRSQAAELEKSHVAATILEELRERLVPLPPLSIDEDVVSSDDIAELVFTSGTTGNPKGVILTHKNITANVRMGQPAFFPTADNRVLSILPLSHMFEQVGGLLIPLTGGSSITYVSSLRPDVIFDAMVSGRITNMTCVPRVLDLVRDGIEREVRRQGRTQQFERLHTLSLHLPMAARRLLFRQLHKRMGGAFEYFVSGGAHLEAGLARWWGGLGIKVAQGYGMTEASPVVATNTLRDRDFNSVGRPVRGVSVRIAEDREILVRGDNITPGYWQNPAATADAFVDNWYKTGDLGYFDDAGRLHLHGRKKNLIVLANGMNVYPEDIEQILITDPRITDAVVLGLSKGQEVEVHAVLLTEQPEVAGEIVRAANACLAPHQHIHNFTIWPHDSFPVTPTLKVKRGPVAERLVELQAERVGDRH